MSYDYEASFYQFIAELRGGVPERCDFCQRPYTEERYPVLEEAGLWSCNVCERISDD